MVAVVELFFLIVSFIAVRHSTNETTSKFVEVGLWLNIDSITRFNFES